MFLPNFGQILKLPCHWGSSICQISVQIFSYYFINKVLHNDSRGFASRHTYLLMLFLLISMYGFSEKVPISWTISAKHLDSFSVQLFTCCVHSLLGTCLTANLQPYNESLCVSLLPIEPKPHCKVNLCALTLWHLFVNVWMQLWTNHCLPLWVLHSLHELEQSIAPVLPW